VGADGKAMGVEREVMACFGGRWSVRKKKKEGGHRRLAFGPSGEREWGGLAIAALDGGEGKGGPGMGGAWSWPAQQRQVQEAADGREKEGMAMWLACGLDRGCGAQP
jgi:hypothetical protein